MSIYSIQQSLIFLNLHEIRKHGLHCHYFKSSVSDLRREDASTWLGTAGH